MNVKKYLLATAGSMAAGTAGTMLAAAPASAADLAIKEPPPPAAMPNWAGMYIGVNAGANWQFAQTHGNYSHSNFSGAASQPVSNSLTSVGFLGGGQIGYNWQFGDIVYGVEADFDGQTGKTGLTQNNKAGLTTHNRIDWLSTFRGRLGFAFGDNLIYGTGGLAVARVNNSFGYSGTSWVDNSTRLGFVAGLGFEHMLNEKWSIKMEALYVDLGKKTVNCTTCSGGKTTTFANQEAIFRLGLNYKLPY